MDAFVADLRAHYGDEAVLRRQVGAEMLAKVVGFDIPGRKGVKTDALVVLSQGFRTNGGRPPVYFKPGTVQPNGRPGRNVTQTLVHGEPWLSMSWQFEWTPAMPAWTLVEGAARRFTVNED